MDQLISGVLAIAIMFFGGYCLAFAVGAVRTHPVTWAGRMVGRAVVGALTLPFRLSRGFVGVIKDGRRKRRRLR